MELRTNMYVRTKDTGICKITEIISEETFYTDRGYNVIFNVLKTSHNIIDLIEVGDYVEYKQSNMYWNIPTRVSGRYNRQQQLIELMADDTLLKNVEITSIVTKEQFKSVEYEV